MNEYNIVAIIVTYNRKELLLQCLEAVLGQSYKVKDIILIDNASTDGTYEMLKEKGLLDIIKYLRMKKNIGGSGGFYEGIKESLLFDDDLVWIMDDDTIPCRDCLENLIISKNILEGNNEKISFLASSVYGENKETMNVPLIDHSTASNGYEKWYNYLEYGMIRIKSATFVSILVERKAVEKCGLPCKDYFIWGDDSEYTLRLTKNYGNAYCVGKSKVIHKRTNAKAIDIRYEENYNRLNLYHYYYRNNLINSKFYKLSDFPILKALIKNVLYLFKIKGPYKTKKLWQIYRGVWEGIVQYRMFSSYIKKQLEGK